MGLCWGLAGSGVVVSAVAVDVVIVPGVSADGYPCIMGLDASVGVSGDLEGVGRGGSGRGVFAGDTVS